jgi:hypothetical protein
MLWGIVAAPPPGVEDAEAMYSALGRASTDSTIASCAFSDRRCRSRGTGHADSAHLQGTKGPTTQLGCAEPHGDACPS